MKVNEDGSLVCCEVGCITPHFGLSSKTRAPYNAALHLRSRHLVQMLRSRATAAAAALVPARKVAKVGAPVRSTEAAAARLGVTILEPDEAIAARSREHEAAQATRLNTEAAHAARRAALSAAASATISAGGTPGASLRLFFRNQKKRLRKLLAPLIYLLTCIWCRHPIARSALGKS